MNDVVLLVMPSDELCSWTYGGVTEHLDEGSNGAGNNIGHDYIRNNTADVGVAFGIACDL